MRNLTWFGCVVALASLAFAAEGPGPFSLEFSDGRVVSSTALRAQPASGESDVLADPGGEFVVTRREIRPEGAAYTRTSLTVTNRGAADLALARIVMLDAESATLDDGAAHVVGEFSGSPVVTGRHFMGVEHPLAENRVTGGRVRCALPLNHALRAGESVTASLVFGAYRAGQLRRDFLDYLERERVRPYAPFLHHNTWYNLGYFNRFSEQDELGVIAALGRELVTRRGVKLDGFVLDDGWDDTHSLWRFHPGWPAGLTGMASAAAKFGAAPGMWLSPWGGYGQPKKARLEAAAADGFEVRDGSFSLAGPRYFARFRDLCAGVVRDGHVVYFKFDGIGSTEETGRIDPAAGRDFDAMLQLIHELRVLRPGIYISQTTGTWPSPWWLFQVDNIWRDGEDHDFAGVGTPRQRWITYRDGQTYRNVVRRGPLFPLNSLMIHGIIFAAKAKQLDADPGQDFASEVRTYFGAGTQLQELYLSPELLSEKNWDDLAAAAKWSRANSSTLRDVHWLGGDPGRLEVYGWAGWSPAKGVITLRNPSDRPATFSLDPAVAFEIPAAAATRYRVSSPYPDSPAPVAALRVGEAARIDLRPFEVLVLECVP